MGRLMSRLRFGFGGLLGDLRAVLGKILVFRFGWELGN